ncbi:GNAT family N-acetyltransferase [Arthrobacter sp.]|uniref:GNAT family N-acetyltransferase n=1 Tax=Arthrobacter sp. TaxID=1667 RepID=UPI003A912208
MIIRPAIIADHPAIADLIQDWNFEEAAELRRPYQELKVEFVAVDGEAIVGWIAGNHKSGCWQQLAGFRDKPRSWNCSYLSLLFVTTSARRKGVARALLTAFEADATANGVTLVVILPDESDDLASVRAFYSAAGYALHEYDEQPQDPYLMTKFLH